ncbi:hypothetical protein [Mucilaginibacter xinganensis]|uniref:hypothetical protein n=1 Tax=Mucilaginibacter xinganensis TaxID=1234841 RepID=UPI000B9905C7|nr:hypothetical protein [Mucilaginibacter xinganensis]
MANNDNEQYLLNEQVSFVQHYLPGLDAGEYKLQIDQQIFESDGITPVSGDAYTNSYTFAVTGDRFSISNPATLNSTFPANNASGEYSNVLPHVVFSQQTFPWIRYPNLDEPYTPPQPGSDVDSDVPTWLWVMLLDEDDIAAFPNLQTSPNNCTIGDLYPPSVVAASTLGSNYSYFNSATDLSGLEPGQNTTDSIQTIDVPLSLFWSLAPSLADMSLLAHGRVVSLVNQPTSGSSIVGEATGSFSIVFGNRLPNTQKKCFAFLVSLEELQDFLPQTCGLPPVNTTYPGTALLRLAILKNWTFFSTGESATFVHQLESLNGCVPRGAPASNTNIRIPYHGSNTVVEGALDMGYVPLNETMRTAENNVSWYRGPLVPYSIPSSTITLPVPSPDAATIFDPTTGMLDTSYSAAWTIGRMVALQDVAFSTGLYNWKKTLDAQVNNNIENGLFDNALGVTAPSVERMAEVGFQPRSLFSQVALTLKKD